MTDRQDGTGSAERGGALGHGGTHPMTGSPLGLALYRLTRWLALAGGVMLLAAMVATVISVTGRYGFGAPLPGDYELVEIVCAVAIFLFFPFTHASDSNIAAEFFTSALPLRYRRFLDTIHDVIFAIVAATLTWRLGHGLVDKFLNGDMSILIHIPLWWAYSVAVLSMALLTVVCVWRVVIVMRTTIGKPGA